MSRPSQRPSARGSARGPRRPAATGALAWHGTPGTSAALETVCGRLAWGVLAGLAAALLVVALGPHRIGDYFTETDFYGAYAEGARLIQHGRLLPSRYGVVGPGYEVVLALVGLVVHDLFAAAEFISVACALIAALLWTGLVRRLSDGRLALFTLLFLATNPVFFRFGYSTTTDALALALQTLALWMLLTRRSTGGALAAGAVAAAAFLTRYSAVALLPTGLVALALGATSVPRRARGALAFAAGFALPVAPWVIYCVTHGSGFSFQLHHNIAYEVFARPRGIVWDDYQKLLQPQFHSLWDVLARDPAAVASRMLFNLADHLRLDARDLLGWPVAIAALLGLGFATLDGTLRRLWPLALFGALAFLVLVPAFHAPRYSLALLPVHATLAAALFASPRFALAAGRTRRIRLKSLLAVAPLAVAVATSWGLQARTLDQLPVEVLDAAATLRGAARPGDRVIARKPHLSYVAGLEGRPFPFADSLPQLAASARQQGARWLYVSWVEVETRPRFWYLLDTTAVVPGLTVRRVTRPHPSVLYEIGPEFGIRPAWMANDTLLSWHTARAQLLVNPDDAAPLYVLGLVELSWGAVDSSTVHLERSVQLDPGRASAWLLLAEIALRRGDAAAAERACRGALAAQPGNIDAQAAMGWASLVAGRPDEAAARWRPVAHAVRDPSTLQRMIALFTETGDLAAAAAARAALARVQGGAMTRTRARILRAVFPLAGAAALAALVSCAGTAPGTATRRAATRAPEPDSITAGVWHFDETGGTRAADAGPFRLDGVFGVDTRTDFGRVRSARRFNRSIESFMFVPYSPALENGSGLTVEAWVYVDAYGKYEDTPIAARWTRLANEQSWLFSIIGERLEPPYVSVASPGDHRDLVLGGQRGRLLFAFQPDPASPPFAYTSAAPIEIGSWTHVGVTYDGSVVRFFIDGRPESQYASVGAIRRTRAPLVVGNSFDPRALSDFAGDLRVDAIADREPYYAFMGLIDELRISTAARHAVTAGR